MTARRPWSEVERDALARLWAEGLPVHEIGERIDRTPAMVCNMRARMNLPERISVFFIKKITDQEYYFKLPLRKGVEKLLNRSATLLEWIGEGRDNYELARAFHIPIADVAYVVGRLGLIRPHEVEAEPETIVMRSCVSCREPFRATRYRFRCDDCLHGTSGIHDSEYSMGAI